jgi:hypothetical protein
VLVRCYVRLYARTLSVGGRPWALPANGLIPAHIVLDKPELPRDEHWGRALKLAGGVFGLRTRSSNTADNLRAFSAALDDHLREPRPAADALPELLAGWLAALGLPDDGPRLLAAQAARDLLRAVPERRALAQVEALAAHASPVGPRALASSLASARQVALQLGSTLLRGSFEQLRLSPDPTAQANALLDELAELLHAGEHERPLVEALQRLGERATALNLEAIRQPPKPRPDPPPPAPPQPPDKQKPKSWGYRPHQHRRSRGQAEAPPAGGRHQQLRRPRGHARRAAEHRPRLCGPATLAGQGRTKGPLTCSPPASTSRPSPTSSRACSRAATTAR